MSTVSEMSNASEMSTVFEMPTVSEMSAVPEMPTVSEMPTSGVQIDNQKESEPLLKPSVPPTPSNSPIPLTLNIPTANQFVARLKAINKKKREAEIERLKQEKAAEEAQRAKLVAEQTRLIEEAFKTQDIENNGHVRVLLDGSKARFERAVEDALRAQSYDIQYAPELIGNNGFTGRGVAYIRPISDDLPSPDIVDIDGLAALLMATMLPGLFR